MSFVFFFFCLCCQRCIVELERRKVDFPHFPSVQSYEDECWHWFNTKWWGQRRRSWWFLICFVGVLESFFSKPRFQEQELQYCYGQNRCFETAFKKATFEKFTVYIFDAIAMMDLLRDFSWILAISKSLGGAEVTPMVLSSCTVQSKPWLVHPQNWQLEIGQQNP